MAHNQYQFQQLLMKQGIKLRKCCSQYHFPIVEYNKGKTVRIYCEFGCGIVTLKREKGMSEEEFAKTAAEKWNTGKWDK